MGYVRPTVFENAIQQKARKGAGWLAMTQRFNVATDSAQTIPLEALLAGLYTRTGISVGRTDTTPTGTQISAALPDMDVGDTFMVMVANLTAQTLTLAGGTDVTASGTLTIGNGVRWLYFEKTGTITFNMVGL